MDFFWNMSRVWSYRNVQCRREEQDAGARRFTEASSAEERCAETVRSNCGYEGIRMNVRVPRNRDEDNTAGRGEIDMILVTHRHIFVVEVKDWVGDVYTAGGSNDDRWIQCAPRTITQTSKRGTQHVHQVQGQPQDRGPTLNQLRLKANALANYIVSHRITRHSQVELPTSCVIPVLVFVNDNCRLDPETQRRHPHAMTLRDFEALVGKRNATWDWITYMCPWATPSSELTWNQQLALLSVIDTLPTWDTLLLHNGTVRNGDVLRFVVPEASRRFQRNNNNDNGNRNNNNNNNNNNIQVPSIPREHVTDASLSWPGSSYLGLLWALCWQSWPCLTVTMMPNRQPPAEFSGGVSGNSAAGGGASSGGGGGSSMVLTGADADAARHSAAVSGVGSPLARRRNAEAEQIPAGHCSVVQVPLCMKLAEPRTSMRVCHVEFRSCGQATTETIALHHVSSLSLSSVHAGRRK